MKTFFFILSFATSFGFLNGQSIDSTLIELKIEGLQPGKSKLIGTYGDQNYVADSSIVDANGKLTLARKSPLPAGFYTFLLPGNKYLSFLVDLDQRFTVTAKAADIPGTAVASGDLNPRLFFENQRFQASIEPELTKLS
jgi:hypothetical protein